MPPPFTMLSVLSSTKSSRPAYAAGTTTTRSTHTRSRLSDDFILPDEEFGASSPVDDDNESPINVEEPSYTIVPKSSENTDIDQEWTDVGAEDRQRARKREEERKRREMKERMEKEQEEKRRKEDERKIREEERQKAEESQRVFLQLQELQRRGEEERRRIEEEERRKKEEEDRQAKEAAERKRKEEDKRKREEIERRLRENYEAAARTREERARDAERKKQELLRAQERQKLQTTIQEREEREQALQARLNVLEDEQQAFAMQIRELMEHSEFLEHQNRFLQDRLDRQSDEHESLKDRVHDSSSQISRLLSIGAVKSSKSVEQEVVMLLDILNAEVYQAAACLADLLESRCQLPMKVSPGAAAEESRLAKVLGKGLTEVLKARTASGADFDPLIVQVALQMCMNHCCAKIVRSWCPGMWNYSDFLSTLFTGIRATEDEVTANKWRTVTHAQFRQNDSTKTSMARFLNEHVMALLSFIGLPQPSNSWVNELLEERCPMIVGPALHINNALFENGGSDRLEVVLVRSDQLFDEFTMENSFGRDGEMGEFVVATTDLGFRRIGEDYGTGVAYLVKPKVVLSTAFDSETRRILEQPR